MGATSKAVTEISRDGAKEVRQLATRIEKKGITNARTLLRATREVGLNDNVPTDTVLRAIVTILWTGPEKRLTCAPNGATAYLKKTYDLN